MTENSVEIGKNISIDWLSFTVPFSAKNMDILEKRLGRGEWEENGFGGLNYNESITVLDTGRVFWHTKRKDMGIHIRLPATALSEADFTATGLLNWVGQLEGKATRIDIAFDDTQGLLDVDQMYDYLLAEDVVTRWQKMLRINGVKLAGGKKTGDTVTIGSRTSNSFLRIYDKQLERESKEKSGSETGHWVRVELELKGQKAGTFVQMMAKTATGEIEERPEELCASLLLGLVDFKERGTADTNKSRWLTVSWWLDFVGGVEKLKLSLPKKEKTMEQAREWIEKTVSPTLAMIVLSSEDDNGESGYEFVMNSIHTGQFRLKARHKSMMAVWESENGERDGKIPLSSA